MSTLRPEKQLTVLSARVEGTSIRGTERITGVPRETIRRHLATGDARCQEILAERMQGFHPRPLQADELWTVCSRKAQRLTEGEEANPALGDQSVFVALDAETQMIALVVVGRRDPEAAHRFLHALRQRPNGNGSIQVRTDGLRAYRTAVESAFGNDVDYAQWVRRYGSEPAGDGRYAPPRVTETVSRPNTWESGSAPHLHVLRGAAELDHSDDVPPVHEADECPPEEAGESQGGSGPAFRLLQLLPDSPNVAGHASDGGGSDGSAGGTGRTTRVKKHQGYSYEKLFFRIPCSCHCPCSLDICRSQAMGGELKKSWRLD